MRRARNKFSNTGTREYGAMYAGWRNKVLRRDRKCMMPGCDKTTGLQCHHIIRWADNYALRFNERNGISLCKTHHKSIKNKEHLYALMFTNILNETYYKDKGDGDK